MRRFASAAVVGLVLLASCQDKLEFNTTDSTSAQEEATVDGYFSDTDDLAVTTVASDQGTATGSRESSGRIISTTILDARFKCATVNIDFAADNSFQVPHGTITIDFGTGCTDAKGNTRKGKLLVEFKGRRFLPGSTVVTTTDGYSINDVALSGTRTITNITASTEDAPRFNVVLDNGMATWPNSAVATREANLTYEWIRTSTPLNDQLYVTGSAAGTTRGGVVYTMEIKTGLVYKRECALGAKIYMAVQGTKEFTANGRKVTIDYGNGDCDRKVTVTSEGQSKDVDVN